MGITLTHISLDHARTCARNWAWEVIEASSLVYFGHKRWLRSTVDAQEVMERQEIVFTLDNGDFVTVENQITKGAKTMKIECENCSFMIDKNALYCPDCGVNTELGNKTCEYCNKNVGAKSQAFGVICVECWEIQCRKDMAFDARFDDDVTGQDREHYEVAQ